MRVKITNGGFSGKYEEVVSMEDRIESLHPAAQFGNFHYVVTVTKRLYVITGMGLCKSVSSAYRSAGY